MRIKTASTLEKMWLKIIHHKMKKKDQLLLVEAVILIFIYSTSFAILSLGRVQKEFLGIPPGLFSSIQIMTLTFIFAVVITLIIYFAYKQAIKWV